MDKYNMKRFIDAQRMDYAIALKEIRNGRKESHWIWYIFPQITGLARSSMSHYYAISGLDEARAYLNEPSLKNNLLEICEALLNLDSQDPVAVMGRPDDLKLRSSMTLFAEADPECDVFQKVLDKYFHGKKDARTLMIINKQ